MDISFSEAKGMFGTALDLVKKGSQMEAQTQIQQLQEQYLDLHAENLELKQELLEIKGRLQDQTEMVFESPFFYSISEKEKQGPFCPRCWQDKNKKCRVVETPDSYNGSQQCQVCDEPFGRGRPLPEPTLI